MTPPSPVVGDQSRSAWYPGLMLLGLVIYTMGIAKIAYAQASGSGYAVFTLIVIVFSCASWRLTYSPIAPVLRLAIRALTIILGGYLALAVPSFNHDSHSHAADLITHFQWIRWVGAGAAVLALWRPGFGLITTAAVAVSKGLTATVLNLPSLSQTDYLPVVEFNAVLILGVMYIALLNWLRPRVTQLAQLNWTSFSDKAPVLVFLFAVAIHFGNYFHSGLAKLQLDGPSLAWVFNNTPAIMEVAELAGHSPIALMPALAMSVHIWVSDNYVLMNIITLASQLASILMLRRIMWTLWLTAFYDITHIVIALLTGIFFWKWILLNIIIVAGLLKLRHHRPAFREYLLLAATVVFGQLIFFTAKLGWYDSGAVVHHYFNAVTHDGAVVRVPSNFFMSGSVTVAQNRLGTPPGGHFPVRTWGSSTRHTVRQTAAAGCGFPVDVRTFYPLDRSRLTGFIQAHHRYLLSTFGTGDMPAFDRYPHHIFSVPWAHTLFYDIRPRDISHYEYVVESICLNGRFADNDPFMRRDLINIPALPAATPED